MNYTSKINDWYDTLLETYEKKQYNSEGVKFHKQRVQKTLALLSDLILSNNIKSILILGGSSEMDWCAKAIGIFDNIEVDFYMDELRDPFKTDKTYDLVLATEIFEHLKDKIDDPDRATFNFSGINNFLSEIHRCLNPNGILFMSTPNINSLRSILRLFQQKQPFFCNGHVREYNIYELEWFLKQNKLIPFRIEELEMENDDEEFLDQNSEFALNYKHYKPILEKFIKDNKFATRYRADINFIFSRKLVEER